jgi:hypothetical protein
MQLFYKLFTPLKYLKIYHKQKFYLDVIFPLVLAFVMCVIYENLPISFVILGDKGLVSGLSDYLKILSGFYIAALAAVATFQNGNMDVPMDGEPLTLNKQELTRRQFLSYLFGYLSFIGFAMVLVGVFTQLLEPSLQIISSDLKVWICHFLTNKNGQCHSIYDETTYWFKLISLGLYLSFFFSIMFTTLLGLYYLTERIHSNVAISGNDVKSKNIENEALYEQNKNDELDDIKDEFK